MRTFIILIFIWIPNFIFGQTNLVLNPSFEIKDTCPYYGSSFNGFVLFWDKPSQGTPDYFCPCSPIPPELGGTSVPNNFWGVQFPKEGSCYAGLFSGIEHPTIDRREYIQGQLAQPLDQGVHYRIEYYVSLANRSTIGLERLGIYFSNGPSFFNTISVLPVVPSAYSTGTFFTDTLNWQKVRMEYTATGGETHFIIGNLLDSANSPFLPIMEDYLDTVPMSPGWNYMAGSYYFIDDVFVGVYVPDYESELNLFPNPSNGQFSIEYNLADQYNEASIQFYNSIGQLVAEREILSPGSILPIDLSHLPDGIYHWIVKNGSDILKRDKLIIVK